MFKRILTSLFALGVLTNVNSQDIPKCRQHKEQQKYLEDHPHLISRIAEADAQLEMETMLREGGDEEVLIIPVVFHVIHDYGPENISDEQIHDAIAILNRDFRKQNADTLQINAPFADLAADIRIEFRLAQLDPSGNCTRGITRTVSDLTYQGDGQMRSLIQWPRDKYMNVWVCNYANGAAGYTFIPAYVDDFFAQSDDGIVLKHDYTGSIGTSSIGRSRTLTHEVGHWLNLRHTWGPTNDPGQPSNCNSDDNVADTPLTVGWTTCNPTGESCGSLDNVQNYMEYSYCSRMFTEGQKQRMRTAAMSGIADRNELSTQENLIATGVFDDELLLCEAAFDVSDRVLCQGGLVNFSDQSYNDVDYWTWDFGDGTIIEGSDPEIYANPTHMYGEPGIYTITLAVEKAGNMETETKSDYIEVLSHGSIPAPLIEGFEEEFPGNRWFALTNEDNIEWQVTDAAAYSGSSSLVLNNRDADPGDVDQLISTTIDASDTSGIEINFRYAYANKYQETADELRFYVSGDCGETWTLKKLRRGDTNLPTAGATGTYFAPDGPSEWQQITVYVNDSTLLTENFMMRFQFTGNGGNNIFLDDINIESQFVSVEEIATSGMSWTIYPNPAEQLATIELFLARAGQHSIDIWDITGRKVMNIRNGNIAAGEHKIELPVNKLNDGLYLIVIDNGTERSTKRLIVGH